VTVALRGIGSIYILESLPPGHLRTGERIFDEIEGPARATSPGIVSYYCKVPSAKAIFDCLESIRADVTASGRSPIVQIEAHGADDESGLVLASGELLPWGQLKAPLTAINITCRLNLLVVVAACNGRGLLEIVQPTDRAPVWGLIGPNRVVKAGEVEVANRAFYRTLFSERDGGIAWQAMNAAVDPLAKSYSFFGALAVFRFVFAGYLATEGTPEALARRRKAVIARLVSDGLDPDLVHAGEPALTAYIGNHQARFDEARAHFFFVDLCPDHRERFPITLGECQIAD
jgi:hypothetical protein